MAHKLKQNVEAFTVVDGPFAKQSYKHGVEYNEIPPQEKHKFDLVRKKPIKTPPPEAGKSHEDTEGAENKDKGEKRKSKISN